MTPIQASAEHLFGGNGASDRIGQNLRAAARQRSQAGLFEGSQDLAHGKALVFGQKSDLRR